MALDPNIILQAGRFDRPDPAQILETRAQLQLRNLAVAKAGRDERLAGAKAVRLGQVGQQAASGDYAGAQRAALSAGDFDLADHVAKLDDRSKAQLHEKVSVAAPVFAAALAEADPARRTQIIGAALPTLQRYGYTPEEIAKIQPTDEFLRGAVANAQTVDQVLGRQDKDRSYALDRDKFAYEQSHDAVKDQTAREGNYLSAGLLPPGSDATPATGGAVAGRTQYGWTPRARNGGDNPDAAVDGKIAGMAERLGIAPTADLSKLSPTQIAEALTFGEGGKGSLADRNNNPANIRDPRTGAYRKFPTRAAGVEAAAAQVRRNLARGQTTIQTMVEGLPVGGGRAAAGGGLAIIPGGKLDKAKDAPSGYRWAAGGNLEPIPGGPGDKQGRQANLKPPPAVAMKAYIGNRSSISKIDDAVKAVDAYPDATGFWKGVTPNAISSRTDPKGVTARALIADIGSLLIHDRSGAAVTVAETPRLLPFVPQVGDDAATAKKKLANLRSALAEQNTDTEDVYSEEQGFKFPKFRDRPKGRIPGTLSPRPAVSAHPADIQAILQKYGAK